MRSILVGAHRSIAEWVKVINHGKVVDKNHSSHLRRFLGLATSRLRPVDDLGGVPVELLRCECSVRVDVPQINDEDRRLASFLVRLV